jgi:hypothetical protein
LRRKRWNLHKMFPLAEISTWRNEANTGTEDGTDEQETNAKMPYWSHLKVALLFQLVSHKTFQTLHIFTVL